jgi:hypothetical protein
VDLPTFSVGGSKFYLYLEKIVGESNYGCHLFSADSSAVFPGTIHFQFDLVKKLNNRIGKTSTCDYMLYNTPLGYGPSRWIAQRTIHDHILKVKVWIDKSFSDFVEKPDTFVLYPVDLLLNNTFSNFSFKVGDDVVYVLYGILTSRSDYFRAMLEGSFKEAQVPISLDAEIPIQGVEVDVFKMIIEWLYTMDIRRLNGLSYFLFSDLERVYVAADMYLLPDLCDSILKYLESLINEQTFGEIYQIAKRIGSKTLEDCVLRSWISKSDGFNNNAAQTDEVIKANRIESSVKEQDYMMEISEEQDDLVTGEDEEVEAAAMYLISQKMIRASSWNGDKGSKTCVIQYIASSLSLEDKTMAS